MLALLVLTACVQLPREAMESNTMLIDPLIYETPGQMAETWSSPLDPNLASLLFPTPEGLSLRQIDGDVYGTANTARAVFVRTPQQTENFFVQVCVEAFRARDPFAQVGLVLWHDADHYVRHTTGFSLPGWEAIAEFDGQARSHGVVAATPPRPGAPVWLRMEVGRQTVRCYASFDGQNWLSAGDFTLPRGLAMSEFLLGENRGIGLIGVGGAFEVAPLLRDWQEGPLPEALVHGPPDLPYRQWRLAQTNGGWGADPLEMNIKSGRLAIQPFKGSDFYYGNQNYPMAEVGLPAGTGWEIEVHVSGFDPQAGGAFHKAGLILWQDNGAFLGIGAVHDPFHGLMCFETLALGTLDIGQEVHLAGHREPGRTDLWLRLACTGEERYRVRASYDGRTWHEGGTYRLRLPEPRLRLYATADVMTQDLLNRHPVQVTFAPVRRVEVKP